MAAILREDPPNLLDANASLPPAVERIVRHCLEKVPQERFASARDLAFDLESISDLSGARSATVSGRGTRATRSGALWAALWAASLLAAFAGAYALGQRRSKRQLPSYEKLTFFLQEPLDGLPKPITPEGTFTRWAFTTPDGAWVAAGSDLRTAPYRLYPLAGGEPRPIPGLEKDEEPIRFHADGRRLFVRVASRDVTKAQVVLLDIETGRRQPWRTVGPADPAGVIRINHVLPTPDGRGYLYEYARTLSHLFLVQGLP